MDNFIEVMVMPFTRIVVMLWSLQVGTTNLGSLILIGILFSVLIAIVTHSSGGDFGRFIDSIRHHDSNQHIYTGYIGKHDD